jgi:16S rRNA (adenine1518-N6/adenine1519-N6)-dimethyltransferase
VGGEGKGEIKGKPAVKIAANLPYYITTPLIEKLIVELPQSTMMLLMIQEEAADRLLAKPGSKLYSPLAILAAQYGQGVKSFSVPAAAYMPQPHVDSCVVMLTKAPDMPVAAPDAASLPITSSADRQPASQLRLARPSASRR